MFKLIWPRVYMVGGPELTSIYDCCVYVIDAEDQALLIDSGLGPSYPLILSNLLEAGIDPSRLKKALATHAHVDHVGAMHRFRQNQGSSVIAHELDAPVIETGDAKRLALDVYSVDYQPCPVDVKISGPEEEVKLGALNVVILHTPGHTPGSISAYVDIEGKRLLFAQDVHGPFSPEWGSSLVDWRRSMERLLSVDADVLLEGHFGVVEPAEVVRRFIEDLLSIT
ncbi:MAG: MBL fold metallo-hydrolase [Candidatus Nezhaarchaeota archaeon]|nr:MBL fold metallo-hydrolase [Candidatus Nezhaarchaeota archaeon]